MKKALSFLLFTGSVFASGNDYLLVLNKSSDSLSFVNLTTMKNELSLPVGAEPHEIGIHPNGRKAYVSNVGANSLSVINLESRREMKRIESADFRFPHAIVFTQGGKQAVVTSEQANKIVVVDVEQDKVVGAIDTDQNGTHMVVLSPDGRWAYFTNRESHTVSVLDIRNMTIVANIPAGRGAEGIALSPDGSQLWVGDRTDNTVTVIDTEQRRPIATLPTGPSPKRAAFSPDGELVFVSTGADEVYVYQVGFRKLAGRVSVGANPGGVVVSEDGKYAYVACGRANEVQVIDTRKMVVTASVAVESGPDGVGLWSQR